MKKSRGYFIKNIALIVSLLIPLIVIFTSNSLAQDWSRYRGDVLLRGKVTLKQPVTAPPSTFQEFQLGGGSVQPLLADLNGDSLPEIIYLRQGRLVAASQTGNILINNFFGATELIAARDLDQDGSFAEIIAINTDRRLLMVINSDGSLRWQFQFPEFATLSSQYIKIADIAPERGGTELIVFPDHTKTEEDARGYFFTNTGLLYSNPVVANLFGGQLNFPQLAIGDLEGNGTQQVVVVGRPRLMIFNGAGELKQQMEFREGDPEGRHYGLLKLADVNGDQKLDAVIVADAIPKATTKAQAITVLQLVPTIKRLWGTTFGQMTLHSPVAGIADLDGDGRSEVVVNLWTGSQQQIRIYRGEGDALGQPVLLATINGLFAWDLRDLDGDNRPELMTSAETVEQPTLSPTSELRIYRLSAQAGNSMVFLDAAKSITGMYVMTRANLAAEEFNQIGASDNSRMTNYILNGPPTRFITYGKNSEGTTNLREYSLIVKPTKVRIKVDLDTLRPGPLRAILNGQPGKESFLVNREVDGVQNGELVIYNRRNDKLRLNTTAPVFTGASFSTQVRVADLDEDSSNEIIVRASSGRILILTYDESLNALVQIGSFAGNNTPIIQALDGDKTRPQIVTTINDGGRLRLVVYDTRSISAAGDIKVFERWGRTFPDIPAGTDVEITTGRFTGTGRFDIFLSTPRGTSTVVSSLDGSVIWTRADLFIFGNHAAVRDTNRDGKDDIYIVSNNLYRIVDGGRGADLVGPINVASLGGDFYSTPILAGDNEVLLVGPATVVKILDQGKMLWNFAKTINGKPVQRQQSQILMGLAELGNGGSFDRIGGNYGENDTFYVYDYQTGLLSYKTAYQPITDIITTDVDGDGMDEFLFGTADAEVVALRASDGALLWSVKVDSFPNDPIMAAIGKDKRTALLFAPGDGTLRMYKLN